MREHDQKAEIIRVTDLIKNYPKISGRKDCGEIEVIRGISFVVSEGEFAAIMGKSGCGKTTLLKMLGLMEPQTAGEIRFRGKSTRNLWSDELADLRRRKIGFVFQDYNLLNNLSVLENIVLPAVIDKTDAETYLKKGRELAEQFGIDGLLDKYPYQLSGGEKQRTAISRALINDPDLILADEPTGNLDSASGEAVIAALLHINREHGKTIMMVTHDKQIASRCSRIIYLRDGRIQPEEEPGKNCG